MRKHNTYLISIITAALISIVMASGISADTSNLADMVLVNGKIVTLDENLPEAEALAIAGDRILDVGGNEQILTYVDSNTIIIDLKGALAIPGLIEGHAHFLGLGNSLMRLDLKDTKSWDDIVEKVAVQVGQVSPGDWIIGRGWHQDKWDSIPQPNVDGLPFHHELSRVSPDNPVLLSHASGHSCIANAKAMAIAGITATTPDPDGGRIIRDAAGEPIGVFLETAMDSLFVASDKNADARTVDEKNELRCRAIELASQECLANGITSFHDAGASFEEIDLFRTLASEGKLDLRLYVMISESNDSLKQRIDDYRIIGGGNHFLTVRAIKRLIDGALGSHGAWLLEPYSDLPQSTGLNTEPIDQMKETARIAIDHGFQLCTHAIGDRGNRETLDIYEEAFKAGSRHADLRWRIEHAQHLHLDDVPRFAGLGVIASMQGIHCTSDGPWVPKRLGDERTKSSAYVWRDLINSGAVVSNGTDAPVENVDPIANFHALVTRRLTDGRAFYPEQCMTREEALQSYTINCAYAAFEENIKGTLVAGKLADITVLSADILTIPENDIPETEVLYTIIGGAIKYRR